MACQQVGEKKAALSQGMGDDTGRMEVLHVQEVDTRRPYGHERRLVENRLANPSYDVNQVHWDVADSRRQLLTASSNLPFLPTACSCSLPLQRQQGR